MVESVFLLLCSLGGLGLATSIQENQVNDAKGKKTRR